jgi:hypothetical protein
VSETLAKLGLPPNRDRGQRGVPMPRARRECERALHGFCNAAICLRISNIAPQ